MSINENPSNEGQLSLKALTNILSREIEHLTEPEDPDDPRSDEEREIIIEQSKTIRERIKSLLVENGHQQTVDEIEASINDYFSSIYHKWQASFLLGSTRILPLDVEEECLEVLKEEIEEPNILELTENLPPELLNLSIGFAGLHTSISHNYHSIVFANECLAFNESLKKNER